MTVSPQFVRFKITVPFSLVHVALTLVHTECDIPPHPTQHGLCDVGTRALLLATSVPTSAYLRWAQQLSTDAFNTQATCISMKGLYCPCRCYGEKVVFSLRPRAVAGRGLITPPAFVFGDAAAHIQSQHTGHTLHHETQLLYHVDATTTTSQIYPCSRTAARCSLIRKPAFVFGHALVNTQP